VKKPPKKPKAKSLMKKIGQVDQKFFQFLRDRKGIDLQAIGKDKSGFGKKESGLIGKYYQEYLMSTDYD